MRRGGAALAVILVVGVFAICDEPLALTFEQQRSYGYSSTFQVALGDLDGDGDLDAVFANMDSGCEVWSNRGGASFDNTFQSLDHAGHGVGIGDLDGDGDLDLVITRASSEYATSVYLNDGTGRFDLSEELDDRALAGNLVTLFDLEGDGDLDAGIYYSSRCNLVYANDGAGHFESLGTRIPGLACWGDLDGDGDVDALVEQHGGGFATWLNAIGGGFELADVVDAPSAYIPGSSALGDIDSDGDLDLVASNGDFSNGAPVTVLLNSGAGAFTYVPDDRFLASAGRLSLADLDGDGALDVLVASLMQPDRIGINDGRGGFVDSGIRLGGEEHPGLPGIGDLDGDGDVDIFLAQYDPRGPNDVWVNRSQ